MKTTFLWMMALALLAGCAKPKDSTEKATNPVIFADVPDVSMVRVGDVYYMASTTMHMNPGLPIMKSTDLVNWELVSYAYDTLVANPKMNLTDSANAYGAGSWAPSIRFHEGLFYATTFSATSGRTHVYTTTDPENVPWIGHSFEPMLHDHSLFFDDDAKVYMLYNGRDIRIVELEPDLSGIKEGGLHKELIPEAGKVASEDLMLHAEGSQLFKHDGKYYLFNITWPRNGMRTVIVHRADQITGPYEGRVALQDRGIAQGCIIDTPEGDWYAYLFRDYGAVGRIPYIVPMKWENGWPVLGNNGIVPDTLDIAVKNINAAGITASDEFERSAASPDFPLAWQWNHNPDNDFWSLNQRPGFLRLTNGRIDTDVLQARNTLTQRTFGPQSVAETAVELGGMKDGDFAGFIALQRNYGYVGVKMENGKKSLVMVLSENDEPIEKELIPLATDRVYLKIACDFRERADKAIFFYSLDAQDWKPIGDTLQMRYTLPHFMGYRFGLFSYATHETGGYVDFDYYRVDEGSSVLQ